MWKIGKLPPRWTIARTMIWIGAVWTWSMWVKILKVVGRIWHPTTMRSIKITKQKIHASPSLFSMPPTKKKNSYPFFFFRKQINKNIKNQNKNSKNGANISLTKFHILVHFGAVCGSALERRWRAIERRRIDPSVVLPGACVHSSLCWSWSSASALDDMMMLPTAWMRSSVSDMCSSMRRLCACALCWKIERRCTGSLLRYAQVCLSTVEVQSSILAGTSFSELQKKKNDKS